MNINKLSTGDTAQHCACSKDTGQRETTGLTVSGQEIPDATYSNDSCQTQINAQPEHTATTTTMSQREQELAKQLQEEREASQRLQQQLSEVKLEGEIAMERQKQAQWQEALKKIKEVQEAAKKSQEEQLGALEEMIADTIGKTGSTPSLTHILSGLVNKTSEEDLRKEEERKKNKERAEHIMEQFKTLQEQAQNLRGQEVDKETEAILNMISQNTPKMRKHCR